MDEPANTTHQYLEISLFVLVWLKDMSESCRASKMLPRSGYPELLGIREDHEWHPVHLPLIGDV